MAKQDTLEREISRLAGMLAKRRRKVTEAEKKLADATARAKHNSERKTKRKQKAEAKAADERAGAEATA